MSNFDDDPSDHLFDWFGDSAVSYLPTFFLDDDTADHGAAAAVDTGAATNSWWAYPQNLEQELMIDANSFATDVSLATTHTNSSNKRKSCDDKTPPRKPPPNKRGAAKSGGGGSGRWAEQLLNPCAAAIAARNPSRVQHFLYVLHDLSSLNGDANHRLAFHGLQALTHHLSGGGAAAGNTFSSSNAKFFRDSLIKFNDISPWFRIPNNVANTSILQILDEQNQQTNLHILDIGVSHGVQWPTLLEELTRRTGGPPPLVRLTVVAPPAGDSPFADGPPNYDFSPKLLVFAKEMNINLQINKLQDFQLRDLSSESIGSTSGEALVVCAQFRLHNLNHGGAPDDRSEFLRVLKTLRPKGVILSENNTECSCNSCGNFPTGFSRRVEQLWRFLESTSAAYKGRESDERRMMEAEAAKVLVNGSEMNERKEKWCERMRGAGFRGEPFGEDTIDGAKALLKKYDSNWEIRGEDQSGNGCVVGLWWKGQPVSFCSLWKVDETAGAGADCHLYE
ncbi:protein NODULATION SIGNALING PATHWAY 1 [Andrographis paniculata]|uniref:protein NODULATION SIGNALING PATHWAY 1 n=1 Tax=Andrographis paniculata TaxID=175694 RepID=UPI0021E88D94|nr:protein NODULATION SIGNALING PATHWAY 1 [Andrographis paniculata]